MSSVDAAKIWSLNYRLLVSVIASVETDITALGLDSKELFLLAEIDDHPYPAELAATMCMPKATVTVYLKRLEAA
jgi:DNA-binding MarR family transcriptional regulator